MPTALIVDDDPLSLSGLVALVRGEGFETLTADDLGAAREQLEEKRPDVVLADYKLPDGVGLELAAPCAEIGVDFILVTGEATVETAVGALRAGAADFLSKPVDEARLKAVLNSSSRTSSYRREISALRSELRELGRFGPMFGASPAMQAVYDRIARVAPTDASVLVTGESGTGKELVAEMVHRLSRRSHRPFVAVNCGAIAANLIESELFGHERGAFTGADKQRKGVFERADQGTLLLDEISEMPYDLQVKLLRVLETGTFTRVGGERAMSSDVRIVAASNRDLDERVAEGKFRADLLYRLRVVPIELPPLRDREDDVRGLAQHFLADVSRREKKEKWFSKDALDRIENFAFPGNVRELRNAVQQAYILADDEIGPEHLPPAFAGPSRLAAPVAVARPDGAGGAIENAASGGAGALAVSVPSPLADVERQVILATLERLEGDKAETARRLGISLKTLYSRLREYSARTATG
jgi:DNA-binding NtrC family response regulator